MDLVPINFLPIPGKVNLIILRCRQRTSTQEHSTLSIQSYHAWPGGSQCSDEIKQTDDCNVQGMLWHNPPVCGTKRKTMWQACADVAGTLIMHAIGIPQFKLHASF